MATRKLEVVIAGDATALSKALKKGESDSLSFQGVFSKMGSAVSAVTVGVGVAAGTMAIEFGKQLAQMAEDGLKWLPALGEQFDEVSDKTRVLVGDAYLANAAIGKSFEDVYGRVASSSADVGTALDVVYQRLGATGPAAETLATQLLNLSRITGTDLSTNLDGVTQALELWNIQATDAPGLIDEMFRAMQATGTPISQMTDDLTTVGPQLQLLGFSVSDVVSLSAGLGKAGFSISDLGTSLNKLIKAHPGKDLADSFDQFVKGTQDGSIKLQDAIDELGQKGGARFFKLAQDGKLNFANLKASIEGGTDSVDKATDATNDWQEEWSIAWHKIELAVKPVADYIFDTMGRIVEAVVGPQFSGDQLSEFSGQWDKWTTKQKQDFIAFSQKMNDKNSIGGIWDDVVAKWDEAWPKISAWLDDLKTKLLIWWNAHGPGIIAGIAKWWNNVGAPFLGMIVGQALGAAWDAAIAYLKSRVEDPAVWADAFSKVPDFMSLFSPEGGLKEAAHKAFGWLGFAEGGVVPGPIGAPMPAIVHGGERVLTPAQQVKMGATHTTSVTLQYMGPSPAQAVEAVLRRNRFLMPTGAGV